MGPVASSTSGREAQREPVRRSSEVRYGIVMSHVQQHEVRVTLTIRADHDFQAKWLVEQAKTGRLEWISTSGPGYHVVTATTDAVIEDAVPS